MSDNALSSLRTKLDSNDSFVRGGHRVMKTAGATRHASRMKRVPVWALDDEKIKQFINCRFPDARTDSEQNRLASRMIRLIYLYYRVGATRETIAVELKISPNAVMCLIFRVNKAMNQPLKPSHRPRKGDSIQTTNGGTGIDHISL